MRVAERFMREHDAKRTCSRCGQPDKGHVCSADQKAPSAGAAAPPPAPPPPPAPQTFLVNIPAGHAPGMLFRVKVPTGGLFDVIVPPNTKPGAQLRVTLPSMSGGAGASAGGGGGGGGGGSQHIAQADGGGKRKVAEREKSEEEPKAQRNRRTQRIVPESEIDELVMAFDGDEDAKAKAVAVGPSGFGWDKLDANDKRNCAKVAILSRGMSFEELVAFLGRVSL